MIDRSPIDEPSEEAKTRGEASSREAAAAAAAAARGARTRLRGSIGEGDEKDRKNGQSMPIHPFSSNELIPYRRRRREAWNGQSKAR